MRPPCLAAGGVPYSGSAGSNRGGSGGAAGGGALLRKRGEQPLPVPMDRRLSTLTPGTPESTVATGRPNGASPRCSPPTRESTQHRACIDRARPLATQESTRWVPAPQLNSQTRQRRRKTAGNHPWPPKSIAGNRLPQNGEPTGPATCPPRRRGHHPHKVVNEQHRPVPAQAGINHLH